jgi:maltooligosyltrehalose synthase
VTGAYQAVETTGEHGRLVAFTREHEDRGALVVAPALVHALVRDDTRWPAGREAWGDARLHLPAGWASAKLTSVFTGERVDVSAGATVEAAQLLASLPVGLWLRDR